MNGRIYTLSSMWFWMQQCKWCALARDVFCQWPAVMSWLPSRSLDYILLEPSAGGYENVLMRTDMFSRFTIAVVRPGFNIKYNIRTLFVEQKKFCGVSAHTWPATFQASKYWSVTVNWLTVCWVRGHKAIRPAGKILHLLEQWFPNGVPRHTGVPWEESRCAVGFWDSCCLIT